MTTTQELIADVQKQLAHHKHHSFFERDWKVADNLKALLDHIESLRAEVERQKTLLDGCNATMAAAKLALDLSKEQNDQLRAQLEAQGEAVAYGLYVEHDGELVLQFPVHATVDGCLSDLQMYARNIGYEVRPLFTHPAPAAPVVEQDRITEALRQALNKLPRYSFHLDSRNNVRRVQERSGAWIEWQQAHELFDPVAVDAALHPTQPKGEKA